MQYGRCSCSLYKGDVMQPLIRKLFRKPRFDSSRLTGSLDDKTVMLCRSRDDLASYVLNQATAFVRENPLPNDGSKASLFRIDLGSLPAFAWDSNQNCWNSKFLKVLTERSGIHFDGIYWQNGTKSFLFQLNPAGAP